MLTVAEIKRFIDDDIASEKKRFAAIGQRYYEAEHDILKSRLFYYNADGVLVEDKTRSNIRICHPFFTELADQIDSYMLSFNNNPIQAKERAEGLQDHLDMYFNNAFWAAIGDLIRGAYVKGFEYLYAYKNQKGRLAFQCADSMGVVEVREADTDDGCKYVVYWYVDRVEKGRKLIKRIEVWSETDTAFYVQSGQGRIELDTSAPVNPRPHAVYTDAETGEKMGYGLGYIPFWKFAYNRKEFSGLKPIKGLIDDYDLMQCGLSNNLVDFDTPLYVVSNFNGSNLDELQQNLKTKKIVGVDSEGGVQVQTVDVPYQARKTKADEDEKNIYRFGMGLNMLGLKDTNATTNMAIRAAYTLLELKAQKIETRLRELLDEIVEVVLAEINEVNNTDYTIADITYDFTRDIPTNETENIANDKIIAETKQLEVNTILNVAMNIGDEEALKAICEVLDMDFEELRGQLEERQQEAQSTVNARADLAGVNVEDESGF